MATTTTKRMDAIAKGLEHDGWYVQATAVRQLAYQRDILLAAAQTALRFCSEPAARDVLSEAIAQAVNP